jgi:hypothetical protein
MIGSELVSLVADAGSYDAIRSEIDQSPDRDLWYGPHGTMKNVRAGGKQGVLAVIFLMIGGLLCLDAFGDVASAWNGWNVTFFVILLAAIGIGALVALTSAGGPAGWERHRFVVRLGDHADIGVGDIWQDKINAVCILEVFMLAGYRGKKLGSVASRMMLRRCFEQLGARRVECSTVSTNIAAMKMSDRMVEEGVLREKWIVRGRPCDEHLYRLLKSEWLEQLASKTTLPAADGQSGAQT